MDIKDYLFCEEADRVPGNGRIKMSAYNAYLEITRELQEYADKGFFKLRYTPITENYDSHMIVIEWDYSADMVCVETEMMQVISNIFAKTDAFTVCKDEANVWRFMINIFFPSTGEN